MVSSFIQRHKKFHLQDAGILKKDPTFTPQEFSPLQPSIVMEISIRHGGLKTLRHCDLSGIIYSNHFTFCAALIAPWLTRSNTTSYILRCHRGRGISVCSCASRTFPLLQHWSGPTVLGSLPAPQPLCACFVEWPLLQRPLFFIYFFTINSLYVFLSYVVNTVRRISITVSRITYIESE